MISGKRLREITGYTHDNQLKNHKLWFDSASKFFDGAELIAAAGDQFSHTIPVAYFIYAVALELLFKSAMVAMGKEIGLTHNLNALCSKAEIAIDENQECTLELLTSISVWRARYPTPTKEIAWDDYHDNVLEKHTVRSGEGNVHITGIDPKRWPSPANCRALWELGRSKYLAILATNGI